METETWVTISPTGHYHNACVAFGYVVSGKHLVVGFLAWNKWYNEQRFTRVPIKPPVPVFAGDTYQIAKSVADELNKSITTTMEGIK